MKRRRSLQGQATRAQAADARARKALSGIRVGDSFQNIVAKMGLGTDNLSSGSSYGFNPISRLRTLLEWIHRGSWLGGVAIDIVADDMTRAGIDLRGEIEPEDLEEIEETAVTLGVWAGLNDNIKWSRLYGGSIAVYLIEGQDTSTPLNIDSVGEGQFKGLLVLDRWMVEPTLQDLVTELGPRLGEPKFYNVRPDAPALPNMRIHYSRCFRMDGVRLPYWQRLTENLWGTSEIERIYDRMVAFDSATTGAAQLVYKSYLRTMKVEGLRELAATGGDVEQQFLKYMDMVRRFQGMEGLTVIDAKDEFGEGGAAASFSGLSDALVQFGQQLAGALQIPLVRLFGQSPAGLNSTGDSDLRTYYDGISKKQESHLRVPVTMVYRMIAQSLGIELPKGTKIEFRPLWQLSAQEKAEIAGKTTDAVGKALEDGLITQSMGMKELKQSSQVTGIFTNITADDIEAAEEELPPGPVEAQEQARQDQIEQAEAAGQGGAPTGDQAPAVGAMHRMHGLEVVIENPKGSLRKGVGKDGPWEAVLAADYGYIRPIKPGQHGVSGATGADGDAVDAFVGPDKAPSIIWLIDQRDPDTGTFDEHKVLLGFPNRDEALQAYRDSYHDGRGAERIGAVSQYSPAQFRAWMASADLTKPASGWFGRSQQVR